ncbi:unannotated protein [freshwater metagenome]|uniref:Unannotated protein n=1 Tax=freshwater metagenome TaxID=449393 RepID=A0A6J7RX14_9ZZZZ
MRGPFDLTMIEAMALAGQFPANLPVCKDGTEEWIPLSCQIQPAHLMDGEMARPKKNYSWDSPASISLLVAGLVVALISGSIVIKNLSEPSRSNSYSSPKTSYSLPASTYTPPKNTYSSTNYTPKPEYSTPNVSPDSTLYRDEQGRTFRVPNSSYQRINAKKAQLETKQRSINMAQAELDFLNGEIDRLRATIDKTNQHQIDLINDKVRNFNTRNRKTQIEIDYFNAAVSDFNAELIRVGTLIR